MKNQLISMNPFLKIFYSSLVSLPAPVNLSLKWNFGSLLLVCLGIQLLTGLSLAATYSAGMEQSFNLVSLLMETSDSNWLVRYIHANGASLFFIFLYLHTGRGMYYSSYMYMHTWQVGVTILLMCMAAAFLGYVLPINQMSFWGASVITNLFSEVPYIGPNLVYYIWGDVTVSNPTITRFFTFHFVIPFVILALVIMHITFLHETGSSNPLGITSDLGKMMFHKYYLLKDVMGLMMVMLMFLYLCLYYPLALGDDENFTLANPSVTPHHIQPEWYFLFAYAILRSIPNKLGGVISLALSVMVLYILPFTYMSKMKSMMFYPMGKMLFWFFCFTVLLLSWIGGLPVEDPYVLIGQIFTVVYFSYFIVNPLIMVIWDYIYKI